MNKKQIGWAVALDALDSVSAGGLHCAWGLYAIRAAEQSAAAGGGLLSPVAVIPLFVGVPLVALALISLLAANRIEGERKRIR